MGRSVLCIAGSTGKVGVELRSKMCKSRRPLPNRPGIWATCLLSEGHDGKCVSRGTVDRRWLSW